MEHVFVCSGTLDTQVCLMINLIIVCAACYSVGNSKALVTVTQTFKNLLRYMLRQSLKYALTSLRRC